VVTNDDDELKVVSGTYQVGEDRTLEFVCPVTVGAKIETSLHNCGA